MSIPAEVRAVITFQLDDYPQMMRTIGAHLEDDDLDLTRKLHEFVLEIVAALHSMMSDQERMLSK